MTKEEIANKWTMNRYRGPHSSSGIGMADKEFFDLLTDDISDYAKQTAIGFAEWIGVHGLDVTQGCPHLSDPVEWLYQLYLNSIK